ncbi:MAG: 3-hydroxybutyryl-CoA dehydrogenase [Actinomycetota bacterium]|nr:3-hydroxybutyryl-CoA dehydrogenase [Actinomycetota bacterium]
MSQIAHVGLAGFGTMGSGVAEVIARAGIPVIAYVPNERAAAIGQARLEFSTERAVERGKLTAEQRQEVLDAITVTTAAADLADVDLVIEAVPENLDLKKDVLAQLDAIVKPEAIFASNTSALRITELAVATSRPSRVIGMHFFNPAPVLDFVELVSTVASDDAVVAEAADFLERIGRTVVAVTVRPGFIANALLFGYLNHAVAMYSEKYASREDIDAAMRFGCGYPMGPLALLDLVGLDTSYDILDAMYRSSRDVLHAPAPLLKQLVTAGRLGRKSGQGFYTYAEAGSSEVVADDLTPAVGGAGEAALREVSLVGVVGTGTMASGIVEVFAKSGYDVVFVARTAEKVEGVKAAVAKSLNRAVSKGRMTEDARDEVLARITGATEREALADVDLVVEAIAEDLEIKLQLFRDLDRICKPGAVLATTTSSLPVIAMAAVTERPADVIGMHFFNPAPIMKLVEVVTTISTASDVTATVVDLTRKVGKHPVLCGDRAGFIVNALLFPYLNDAVRMVEAHYATTDDVDTAMTKGCSLPMGPFALLDVVGNDVSLAIQETLYREFREPGYAPAPMLREIVTAGYLGRKTGRGFRSYAR